LGALALEHGTYFQTLSRHKRHIPFLQKLLAKMNESSAYWSSVANDEKVEIRTAFRHCEFRKSRAKSRRNPMENLEGLGSGMPN
jgi:hypothetical protein